MRSAILAFLLLSCSLVSIAEEPMISITPKPAKVEPGAGTFLLTKKTPVLVVGPSKELKQTAGIMAERLKVFAGFPLAVHAGKGKEKNAVIVSFDVKDASLPAEGYRLNVEPSGIHITGKDAAGVLFGFQSLFQLIPPKEQHSKKGIPIPAVRIEDSPRFGWRGMHLDVSRHFFPKEFVKTYIDMLSMHKMNVFHWHLVDDHGWRIEIKKYPKLTEVGAWRVDQEDRDWRVRTEQQPGEKATYGGFYTQAEIREIVQYAADRHITVVPEIEMPAHVRSVLAAYPEYSCSGNPVTVPPGTYWPCVDIYCAGNEATFGFLEDVMDEVLALFPSKFIHVGGDEADKTAWKSCAKCQDRMKQEGLKDENELQSYFIKRMEKFLINRDRRLIGWDEILEGGLAPEATVMSWRGIVGGIEAARQGHDVVMAPTDFCYFDYYQGIPALEPVAIGGYVPLSKVYSYEPIPDSLTEEEAKHVLGVQANIWTEYIQTPSHVQYMALPRMAALAEVGWSSKGSRDWSDFARRIEPLTAQYSAAGYNFAKSAYQVKIEVRVDSVAQKGSFVVSTEVQPLDVRYTVDGTEPTASSPLYKEPVIAQSSMTFRAASFKGDQRLSAIAEQRIALHLAAFKPVTYREPYERYTAGGNSALTDGLRGSNFFSDGRWQGFRGRDAVVVIDLGEPKSIKMITTSFMQNSGAWIFLPVSVEYMVSLDGQHFELAGSYGSDGPGLDLPTKAYEYPRQCNGVRARYIQVVAKNIGTCPDWHPGKGQPSWIFLDEIVVE